ncbi:MAG: AAA family ATPase [Chloroflexaceae bacterium]|jgi:circadian clock protein KaiC|nr:AAA family ATPase [Chloroflexaceae bacterium]
MQDHAHSPVQLERLTTGSAQLDQIIGGGIPHYTLLFVAGLPGTGKTILTQQLVFSNARAGKTCLYLTTFSEPPIKLLRYAQGFSFFAPELFGQRVIYGDLGGALRNGGPDGLLGRLDELVRQHRPAILVIDSFKALRDLIHEPFAFRAFTLDLAARMATWEVTAVLVGEYSDDDLRGEPEFAIADGIIYLYGTEEAERQKRFLRVMKLRGSAVFSGEHYFDIGPTGVSVYPRMQPGVVGEYAVPTERLGSLVEGLDELLGGGLFNATATLIGGTSGTGKTLLALSFLVRQAQLGVPGLLVSFEESPGQIARNSQTFGWNLEALIAQGLIDIFHVSPSELNIDRHAAEFKERAERMGARCVVIDSISAFEASVLNPAKYQGYLWAIADYFKRSGIAIVMTSELPGGGIDFLAGGLPQRVSFISDTIILLRHHELAGQIGRTITVLKMRGSSHDHTVRPLLIAPPRFAVGPPKEAKR